MVLGMVCLPSGASPQSAKGQDTVQLIDLMPDFWSFWDRAEGKPASQQLSAWQVRYVQPNAAVFHDLETPCARHLNSAAAEDYFGDLPELISGMRTLESSLPETISRARLKFQGAFPDMAWRGDIYLMASAGCFNGRSQKIAGREALLLGLDDIVGLHETNLPPMLEHELFHRYHHSFFAFEPEQDEPMWVRLWAEGMATYVSTELSPSATHMETMMMTDQKVADLNANRAGLAASFLRVFDSTAQSDADPYFLQDVSDNPGVPGHTGYYLGFLVAQLLNRQYSLIEMAHWDRAQAESQVRRALLEVSAETSR